MCQYVLMKYTYSPKEFGSLVGKTTKTLQRWDREGILIAHRSVTNRRYYSHDQYLQAAKTKKNKNKNKKRNLFLEEKEGKERKRIKYFFLCFFFFCPPP